MPLPHWLDTLRRLHIVGPLREDPRTISLYDAPLGVPTDTVFRQVVGGGQADFAAEWRGRAGTLSPDERARLYAYLNQPGHLEELIAAFEMLAADAELVDPVLIDLGCGPCTGGLALAQVLGREGRFTYIGVDRAASMRQLGEALVLAANGAGWMQQVTRHWLASLDELRWFAPRSLQPVLVLASYLLASETVDARALVGATLVKVDAISQGDVAVLYTNSVWDGPNLQFPAFRDALVEQGFELVIDDKGNVPRSGRTPRELRYALFFRHARRTLKLGGG